MGARCNASGNTSSRPARHFSTNIDLEGKFEALGGKHTFLMGLDYLNTYYDYYFANGAALYPIDIFSPIYGTVPSFAYLDFTNRIGIQISFVCARQTKRALCPGLCHMV